METDQLKHQVLEEIRLLSDPDDEAVAEAVVRVLGAEGRQHFLSLKQKQLQARTLFNAIRRLDILQELIDDEGITEIMIIGTAVFVEEAGRIRKWEKEFSSMETVEDIVQRIAGNSNRMLNTRTPMADARLPDGSRVHLVVPPVALDGPVVTIRRFPKDPIRMRDLIAWESISEEAAAFLERLVRAGYNLFISGGTGSGKTTFLNALTEYIPREERVILIEDNAELQIRGIPNLVRLEAREKNLEGENEITIRQLVRAALRMRPTRLIIGEIRGEEAIDLLQAMNTGHDGSISTGHANSTRDMLSRMETMVLMGMDIPMKAIRSQIASGIDILVHLGRLRDRSRKVLEISEILGAEEEIRTRTLYAFEEEGEYDGNIKGKWIRKNPLQNTGKLAAAGLL
ncbi:MAG: ATPase, T2SS/T4P/T4SS family [Lachnospiraceae bacterium]|nr:ATPase, T2SS/T4P/T4SS family [Oscillospiraceae bacterium]MDY5540068.1 ATPase, T2SS/T4P/T4SS family [Lachnospiraceae bacterium]